MSVVAQKLKNQRKMEIKMLVNKKTDSIIGKIQLEMYDLMHDGRKVFLLAGKSNFVTAGNDFEVRKFKVRTK